MAKREAESASAFSRGIGVSKFNLEMLGATIAAIAAITLVWTFSQPDFPVPVLVVSGAVFTVSVVVVIRLMMDPDSVRALQSDAMLQLARNGGMVGVDYTGTRYDMGNKLGMLQAAVEVGLAHAEVGPAFRQYLKDLAGRL